MYVLHTTEHLLCARYCVHFRGINSSSILALILWNFWYCSFIHFAKEMVEAWRVSWWEALLRKNLVCGTPKVTVNINVWKVKYFQSITPSRYVVKHIFKNLCSLSFIFWYQFKKKSLRSSQITELRLECSHLMKSLGNHQCLAWCLHIAGIQAIVFAWVDELSLCLRSTQW